MESLIVYRRRGQMPGIFWIIGVVVVALVVFYFFG
jgi:hypothetical protein